jgi:hypothetical protein
VWRAAEDRHPHPSPLKQVQEPPEPHLRQTIRITQFGNHLEHAAASHQNHRVYRADADSWVRGDQEYVDDDERWGDTVCTADATNEATRLYKPRNTAHGQ